MQLRRRSSLLTCIGIALAASACGSSTIGQTTPSPPTSSASARPHVMLVVPGAGTRSATSCGSRKLYTLASPGSTATLHGTIAPAPPAGALVRVKLKTCVGRAWQTETELHLVTTHAGNFQGQTPLPGPGSYTVRAYFDTGATTIESAKVYLQVAR